MLWFRKHSDADLHKHAWLEERSHLRRHAVSNFTEVLVCDSRTPLRTKLKLSLQICKLLPNTTNVKPRAEYDIRATYILTRELVDFVAECMSAGSHLKRRRQRVRGGLETRVRGACDSRGTWTYLEEKPWNHCFRAA